MQQGISTVEVEELPIKEYNKYKMGYTLVNRPMEGESKWESEHYRQQDSNL